MRGSRGDRRLQSLNYGIIPAHAGLTTTCSRSIVSQRDHPRACGAHRWRRKLQSCHPGSSPRMRGSPLVDGENRRNIGIIPAHAGLTLSRRSAACPCRDHPRACGAHQVAAGKEKYSRGSSPRMRGSPLIDCAQ